MHAKIEKMLNMIKHQELQSSNTHTQIDTLIKNLFSYHPDCNKENQCSDPSPSTLTVKWISK